MKHLRKFNTSEEYNAYELGEIDYPSVCYIEDTSIVKYHDAADTVVSVIYIDQNVSDPAAIISGDVNGKAIKMIRKNSHRYLGKKTASSEITICQLDDTDSTKYADGTNASLTGAEGDVFMKLPKFFYKAVETQSNKWEISFCYGTPTEGDWQEWGGNELIGVYESYVSNNKMYSVSGVDSSANIGLDKYKTYATARGAGYSTVKWKHHNMMAILFYAMYGNTNCQKLIGYGDGTSNKIQGASNLLGMEDTTQNNGNSGAINFWGLENWWGNKWEAIDNILYMDKTYTIQDESGTRTLSNNMTSKTVWAKKLYLGQNLDCIPTEEGGSGTTGFCDEMDIPLTYYNQYHICRGGRTAAENCGITNLVAQNYGASFGTITSRLTFKGTIITETDVQQFKSLTNV